MATVRVGRNENKEHSYSCYCVCFRVLTRRVRQTQTSTAFGALRKHAGYTKLRDQLQALQILVSQFPLLLPTYHLT